MVRSTAENGKEADITVRESTNSQMEQYMKENGKTTCFMVAVCLLTAMAASGRVSSEEEYSRAKDRQS